MVFLPLDTIVLQKRDKDEFTLGFKRRGVWWMGDNLDKDSGLFDKQNGRRTKEHPCLLY